MAELFSAKAEAEAQLHNLSVRQLAYGALVALGFSKEDSYKLVINPDVSKVRTMKVDIIHLEGNVNLTKYIEKEKNKNTAPQSYYSSDEDETEEMYDKDAVARDLLRTARSLPKNDPKRAEVLIKYAELFQMKKETSEDETKNKLVHFYMPVRCYQCNLYMDAMKKAEEMRKKRK